MAIQLLYSNIDPLKAEIAIEDLVDCQEFAEQVATLVQTPWTIALSGTLGAGKTQWTRYFAMALGAPGNTITSPTFMLVHQYASQPPIFHLDTYRVGDEEEMLELGFEEMLETEAVTIIEWSDRFPNLLPRNTLYIHFECCDIPSARRVVLTARGNKSQGILAQLIDRWL
jgi:tRNA threonylcarbamoyladenosine biosynthesis protein TsaE